MPYNGSGVFTILNQFIPNTTILSAAVNQNFTDIATGLSTALTRDGQAGMTAAFKAIAGTLGAPGISFTNDATSGVYLASSGVLGYVSHSLGMLLDTTIYNAQSAAVQAGGSGYAVGDVIYASGGTSGATLPAAFTVATLSGSAVATVTVAFPGFYSAIPSNPVSQASTSGVGTGCTLNVTWNDPTSSDYRAFFTDQSGGTLWEKFGASSFSAGLMKSADALAFAQGIGGTALATAIGGTLLIRPQGLLTPNSSSTLPVAITDYTAQTRIYWTPLAGDVIPIYDGTQFVPRTSAQIFCDLTAGNQVLGGIYDIYSFINGSTVTLGLSPSWSAGTAGSVTAGSCARGTGTGGAALSPIRGIYVNAAAMTVNNGATTYAVPVSQGTYLGSVYINAVAGQYNCYIGYGQSRVWGLWNAYNRQTLILKAGDPNGSWVYSTTTIRPCNGSTANSITVFTGLQDQRIQVDFVQAVRVATTTSNSGQGNYTTGIGWNSTTGFSGVRGTVENRVDASSSAIDFTQTTPSRYTVAPSLGINIATALETTGATSGSPTITRYGQEPQMLLEATYQG